MDSHSIPVLALLSYLYPDRDIKPVERLCNRIDEEDRYFKKLESDWEIQKSIEHVKFVKAHKDEPDNKKARRRFLEAKQKQLYEDYEKEKDVKKAKVIEDEIKQYEQIKEGHRVTELQIQSAKQYPIGNIIKIDRSQIAKCINHTDKNPSMNCKNNFVYCHTCQYSGDAIDVYMKIHNVSFKEAVLTLSTI